MIFYLQNNNKFLVSIFPSKLIFTSIPWSKLDVNSLEFFPLLSQFLELALFEKLHDCERSPSFKELLDVANPQPFFDFVFGFSKIRLLVFFFLQFQHHCF